MSTFKGFKGIKQSKNFKNIKIPDCSDYSSEIWKKF